jgi:hypothetical protein
MSEKDSLVSQSKNQVDNNATKASDYPNKSGGPGGQPGKDQLVPGEGYLGSPRNCQDGGDLTPSDWGKGGTQFKVGVSKGGEDGPAVSHGNAIDLVTGKMIVGGYSATRVGEVGDPKASIPSK